MCSCEAGVVIDRWISLYHLRRVELSHSNLHSGGKVIALMHISLQIIFWLKISSKKSVKRNLNIKFESQLFECKHNDGSLQKRMLGSKQRLSKLSYKTPSDRFYKRISSKWTFIFRSRFKYNFVQIVASSSSLFV